MSTMRGPFFTIKRAPQTGYWYVCQDGHWVYDNDRVLTCLCNAGLLQPLRGVFFRDPQLAAAVLCGGRAVVEAIPILSSAGLAYVKIFSTPIDSARFPFFEKRDLAQVKAVLRLNGFEVEE